MATPSAILSILLSADDSQATAKLTAYNKKLDEAAVKAKKGISATLGGSFNDEAFSKYQQATSRAQRIASDRKAFKAELGANYSAAGFRAYEKDVDRANRSTEDAEAKTSRLTGALGGLTGGLLAAGAGFGAYEAAKDAIDTTVELTAATIKLQAATGLDAQTSSEWIEVAKVRGVQANSLSMGFIGLEKNIRNAADGSAAATLAFQQLGIPIKGLKDQNLETTIEQIADKFQDLQSPVERAALAQQLFGRNAKVLLPVLADGSQGIQQLLGAAQEYGAYISDKQIKTLQQAHEAQLQLNLATDGLKIAFTQVALPAIVSLANGLLKFIGQMRDGTGEGGKFAAQIASAFKIAKDAVGGLIDLVGGLHNLVVVVGAMTAAFVAFKAVTTIVAIASDPLLAAFVAIALAATEIYTHWKPISAFFVQTWNTIEHAVGQGAAAILGAVSGMLSTMADVANVKVPFFGRVFHGAADSLRDAADSVNHLRDNLEQLGETHQKVATMSTAANSQILNSYDKTSKGALGDTSTWTSKLTSTVGAAVKGVGQRFAGMDDGITTAVQSSVKATSDGAGLINKSVNGVLKSFDAKQVPSVAAVATNAIESAASSVLSATSFAGGGLMQIGRPGQGGHDSVPLNVGGMPVMVAPGEQVAVFNRHQLPIVNQALAPMGGLPGLFSKVNTPNYMAGGGMVPGFAGGGALSYAQLESLWDQAGGPASAANVAAAITFPESGANPSVVQQGQPYGTTGWGLWQITPGNSEPQFGIDQALLVPINNARAAVAKYRGAGNSFSPWTTYMDGAYKAFLKGGVAPSAAAGLAALVSSPKVNGGGVLASIVTAGLGKETSAANAFLAKASASATSAGPSVAGAFSVGPTGGGFDPSQLSSYDGLPVAKWIIPELAWARSHGWGGQVTSGYRSPSQVVHGVFATAPQGQSEHRLDVYPGGAVDVSDYQQFASIIAGYPGTQKLIQLPIDPLHFSGTGHARGGMLPFAGSFDKGGVVPGPKGMPSVAIVHGQEVIHAATGLSPSALGLGAAGLGGTSLPSTIINSALQGHPNWQIPAADQKAIAQAKKQIAAAAVATMLKQLGTIPSQGVGGQIQLAQLGNQLQTAQNAGDVTGQQNALNATLKLEQGWVAADKKKLAKINKALSKKGLSKSARASLLSDKLALLQEIGTVESDIGSAQSSLSDLTSSTDTSGTDTSDSGDQATEDLANAIAAQTAAMEDLKASIDTQNAYIQSVGSIEGQQALKAVSDLISGQIGGKILSRSTGSAGNGTVARY